MVLLLARWLGVVAVVQAASLPLGGFVGKRDMTAAKAYCEELVPSLEAYREEHGCFPSEARFSEISASSVAREPHLLREQQRYYSPQCDDYSFTIFDPKSILGFWQFDSDRWFVDLR